MGNGCKGLCGKGNIPEKDPILYNSLSPTKFGHIGKSKNVFVKFFELT